MHAGNPRPENQAQVASPGPVPVNILLEAVMSKPRVRAKLEARLKVAGTLACDLGVLADELSDPAQQELEAIALLGSN